MNNCRQTTNQICIDLQNYMFTSKNIDNYTKHIIHFDDHQLTTKHIIENPSHSILLDNPGQSTLLDNPEKPVKPLTEPKKKETMYRPKQTDSLFWCFYILKNGYFNYEMEINNQYFVVEKSEKFKYIEKVRQQKALLKLHKLKPLTEIEDDLANKPKISIKTFFALCVLENINIMLVNKRKIYELLCVDIDDQHPIHIVHRNSKTYEHQIELDITEDIIQKYRDTYFKVSSFDATLKSIGSYKLEELFELCKKLDISIETKYKDKNQTGGKKITKKDIYEMLVLEY